jgi:hypothetical protein
MRKTLAFLALAGLGAVGAQSASACTLAAWNGGTQGPSFEAGEPLANGIARYSGRCGARANAATEGVTDNTPSAEARLFARFYVFTGLTGGSVKVFRGMTGAAPGTELLSVDWDAPNGQFDFNAFGTSGSVNGVVANRWYSVHLDWNRTTSTLTANVQGAGSLTALPQLQFTGAATMSGVDFVNLGWVATNSGSPTGNGLLFDAYESRRATAIPRLCPGDANNSGGALNIFDIVTTINEINQVNIGSGQPDINEDAQINVFDLVVLRGRINTGFTCS